MSDKDVIYRQDAIDAIMSEPPDAHYPTWYADILCKLPSAQPEIVRCKDCKWGREVRGNIECFVDSNIPSEYHGYEWFCPNGERGYERYGK